MKVTQTDVLKTVEDTINENRSSKIKLSGKNSPSMVMSRLSQDDLAKFDKLGMYKGISANRYSVQMSMLWSTIFWKISEQILQVGSYQSPFAPFYKSMDIGTDIEELAPRIKDGLDRTSLSNSALLANYITQYDSFYHRVNKMMVFPTTYSNVEIGRISTSWATLTNFVNAELENLIKSSNTFLHDLGKNALSSQYLSGGMQAEQVTLPTTDELAKQLAIQINTIVKNMTIEPSTDYIPFNLNSNNPTPTIRDVAVSDIYIFLRSDIYASTAFRTILNTYFGDQSLSRFKINVIELKDFSNTISSDIAVTPGYTAPTGNHNLLGVIAEEDALIFRLKEYGTYNFDNAVTLNTSVFHHLDAMANVSDRRKVCAITD